MVSVMMMVLLVEFWVFVVLRLRRVLQLVLGGGSADRRAVGQPARISPLLLLLLLLLLEMTRVASQVAAERVVVEVSASGYHSQGRSRAVLNASGRG